MIYLSIERDMDDQSIIGIKHARLETSEIKLYLEDNSICILMYGGVNRACCAFRRLKESKVSWNPYQPGAQSLENPKCETWSTVEYYGGQ